MNRLVVWFATNPVAANLLMVLLVAGGLAAAASVHQEAIPEVELPLINVVVEYPGAAPSVVENAICERIEGRLEGLQGVKRIHALALDGVGRVTVELEWSADLREVLDAVKARVDAIDSFPEHAKKPIVHELELPSPVIAVAVSGPGDGASLQEAAESLRDRLIDDPDISTVGLIGAQQREISIEISESQLRGYRLTFDDVAAAVRRSSLDLPGGTIETRTAEVRLRTEGQAWYGADFERIPLVLRPDGTRLLLGDVASVTDGFAKATQRVRLAGSPAILVQVYRIGDERILDVAEAADRVMARMDPGDGVAFSVWRDESQKLSRRLEVLGWNGLGGLVLVMLVLTLFLRIGLALWVSSGMLISFVAAIAVLPLVDVSINMMSLFGFIVALGLVVDDAIVIGESVHRRRGEGAQPLRAAIDGANEVATPVIVAALTTVAVLVPGALLPTSLGQQAQPMPIVVAACLFFSLVESLLILPSHLAHLAHGPRSPGRVARGQDRFSRWFTAWTQGPLRRAIRSALHGRILTLSCAAGLSCITLSAIGSGWIPFTFIPEVDGDYVTASYTLPHGSPLAQTEEAARVLERSAEALKTELREQYGQDVILGVLTFLGEQPEQKLLNLLAPVQWSDYTGTHLGEVMLELVDAGDRPIPNDAIALRWHELTGGVPGLESVVYAISDTPTGHPIHLQLAGEDLAELRSATAEVKRRLAQYRGVQDLVDSDRAVQPEIRLRIRSEGEALGIASADLARQIHQGYYGEEIQRIQRGDDEVAVFVRYTQRERLSTGGLDEVRIRTPDGAAVPLGAVAQIDRFSARTSIRRVDGRRTLDVMADVDENEGNANEILARFVADDLPEVLAAHPLVRASLEGQQREQSELFGALARGWLLAMIVVYALLAVPLRSYLQPLVIMSAIPLGAVGAVWGHVVMGMPLTAFSLIGVVALSGIVVNNALVLSIAIREATASARSLAEAVEHAVLRRVRPIVLTSLTTFGGLLPILGETDPQSQLLKPVAVSLAVGVLFATLVTILVVPAMVLLLDDLRTAVGARLRSRRAEGASGLAKS